MNNGKVNMLELYPVKEYKINKISIDDDCIKLDISITPLKSLDRIEINLGEMNMEEGSFR